jgi:hypothetical protein
MTSNKLENLLHLVGWFSWKNVLCTSKTYASSSCFYNEESECPLVAAYRARNADVSSLDAFSTTHSLLFYSVSVDEEFCCSSPLHFTRLRRQLKLLSQSSVCAYKCLLPLRMLTQNRASWMLTYMFYIFIVVRYWHEYMENTPITALTCL